MSGATVSLIEQQFPDIQDEARYCTERLSEILKEEPLLKVSYVIGVSDGSLVKILTGKGLSRYLLKKISRGLRNWDNSDAAIARTPRVRRILSLHRRYQVLGTLAEVGREMGLSRERVRQLLTNGEKLGLFHYRDQSGIKSLALRVSREKLLEGYRNLLQLRRVAERNNLSIYQVYRLVRFYRITKKKSSKGQGWRVTASEPSCSTIQSLGKKESILRRQSCRGLRRDDTSPLRSQSFGDPFILFGANSRFLFPKILPGPPHLCQCPELRASCYNFLTVS